MSHSASSWSFRDHGGPVRVRWLHDCRYVYVDIRNDISYRSFIGVDTLRGLARATTRNVAVNKQLANAFRRFLELVDARRYDVELRDSELFLLDKIKKTRQKIPADDRLDFALPVRSTLLIHKERGYMPINIWEAQYQQQKQQGHSVEAAT